MLHAALESVAGFERLIDEFPGGRSGLDASLSGLDDRVHQRNIRGAAQAIHKSMASLLGYQADAMLASILIQPSAEPGRLDEVLVLGKYGVRRLRASSPITVFGRRGEPDEDRGDSPRVESLDGQLSPENGNAYLLTDFCSRPLPPLSLFRTERAHLYTLSEHVPAVNTPVSLVAGIMVRSAGRTHRTDSTVHHWESQVPRMPCRVLVNDVFVRDDVFTGSQPVVTSTLHSIASGPQRPDAPAFHLDNVDVRPSVTSLGMGLAGIGTRDVPRYTELMGSVFQRVGWDASRFRGYRCRVQYPVPLVSVTFWFEIPLAPAGSAGAQANGARITGANP